MKQALLIRIDRARPARRCAAVKVTRAVRRANLRSPHGSWSRRFVLSYPLAAAVNSVAAGALLSVLSIVFAPARRRFGGDWTVLWRGTAAGTDRAS
ncbi:hypothetical protein [Sandaracinus amylolyticus]|uniref:hypothetical protein n=1 Tax=Sandaracinus amylolyticus TaxID=927083 RepID=UPI001F206C91|nr:hypothetical protein [Sandaracinus amylolyticus]